MRIDSVGHIRSDLSWFILEILLFNNLETDQFYSKPFLRKTQFRSSSIDDFFLICGRLILTLYSTHSSGSDFVMSSTNRLHACLLST